MGANLSFPAAFADAAKDDPPTRAPFSPLAAQLAEVADAAKPAGDGKADGESKPSEAAGSTSDASKSSSTDESSESLWGGHRADVANPGTFEEISNDATQILRPNVIDGLSFNFNAPLSDSFGLGTALDLGAKTRPPSCGFNANFMTNRVVMLSRTTPADGRVNARVFINHSPALISKIIADVSPDADSSRLSYDLDMRAARSSTTLKAASGRVVAVNHLHAVTPRLALGAEVFCQTRSGMVALSVAGKYQDAHRVATLSVASFGPIVASYVRKVNPKVQFASELFVDTNSNESHVSMGYRFDLSSSTVTGTVDSSGKVSATLEERINPALSLTLCGELDHAKDQQNFGFGVTIGGG